MSNRITTKDLQGQLEVIAKLLGKATSRKEAEEMGAKSFLYLEYASAYGGYRVVTVKVDGGSHSGAFGGNGSESRLAAKETSLRLDGIFHGIVMTLTDTVA